MTSTLPRHPLRWPALIATAALTIALAAIPTAAVAQDQPHAARLVRDSNTDPLSYGVGIGWVAPLGNSAVFSRSFLNRGPELWISNGTTAGTRPIREAPLGPEAWHTGNAIPFGTGANAKVAFYRISAIEGEYKEVWATDGTDAGTRRVSPSPAIKIVSSLTGTSSGVFFLGDRGSLPPDLFFSDGSQQEARSLNPIGEESTARFTDPSISFTRGAWCYFIANRNEVWRSDGTDAGTTKLATFPITPYGVMSAWAADTQMFVAVRDSNTSTHQVWSCPLDGGSITHAYPPAGEDAWQLLSATTLGEQLYFDARDDEGFVHLMVSDGTEAGTREIPVPVKEDHRIYGISFTRWHGAVYAFVTQWDGELTHPSYTLHRIDGTSDELTSLGDFGSQAGFYSESAWREQQDFLYFLSTNAKGEGDLWQTKGTLATTRKAKGIPARHYLRAEWEQYVTASESGIYYAALGSANTSGLSLWFQPHGKSGGAKRLTLPEKWTASGIPSFWWFPYPHQSLTYDMFDGRLMSFVTFGNSISDDRELWSMNPDGSRAKAVWKAPGPWMETTPCSASGAPLPSAPSSITRMAMTPGASTARMARAAARGS